MKNKFSKTELPFPGSSHIDSMPYKEALELFIQEQIFGIKSLQTEVNALNEIIQNIYCHLFKNKKSRLIYTGAGTSARIAVQDGVELYPTFGWPKNRTSFIIAGGEIALTSSIEGAEDDVIDAQNQFLKHDISSKDVLIGVAASGNTPFTCKVIELASLKNALTISITNNPNGEIAKLSKLNIVLDTSQEIIAGSTRLKAGTAQKACLNIISSMVMIKFGFVKHGMMNNMIPLNKKLKKRKKMIDEYYSSLNLL